MQQPVPFVAFRPTSAWRPGVVAVGVLLMSQALAQPEAAVADRLLGSLQVDATKARTLLGWTPPVTMQAQLRQMALLDGRLT